MPMAEPRVRMPPRLRGTGGLSARSGQAALRSSAAGTSISETGSKEGDQAQVLTGLYLRWRCMAANSSRSMMKAAVVSPGGPAKWMSFVMARMSTPGYFSRTRIRMGWMPRQNRMEPSVSPCCWPEADSRLAGSFRGLSMS